MLFPFVSGHKSQLPKRSINSLPDAKNQCLDDKWAYWQDISRYMSTNFAKWQQKLPSPKLNRIGIDPRDLCTSSTKPHGYTESRKGKIIIMLIYLWSFSSFPGFSFFNKIFLLIEKSAFSFNYAQAPPQGYGNIIVSKEDKSPPQRTPLIIRPFN